MGFWASTSIVVGNMIGAGIFLLPASLAAYGGIGIVGWIFASIGAMLLSYMFGALSTMSPDTIGGPYVYARLGLGDFAAFLVAWGYWVAVWATNAAIAVALVGYLEVFFPILGTSPFLSICTGLGFIWLFSWINSKPLKTVAFVQLLTTILKVIPILLIGIVGIFFINWDHFSPFNLSDESTLSAITSTTTLTLFAFLGMESAGIVSANTKDAAKTVNRATIIGTAITVVVYISSSIAIFGIIPPEELALSTAPFADAGQAFWGQSAKYIVAGCAVIATMGALNGWILLQGRIPMAAAQDELFPRIFGKTNRHGSPVIGIILSSILATGLMMLNYSKSLVDTFTFMIMLSTLSCLIPYLFSAASLVLLIFDTGERRITPTIWLAAFSFIFCLWIIIGCGQEIVFYGFILLMVSVPFYVILKRKK
ncbi:MAG: amino acid permease [Bacteroidota bacterium]